MSNSDAAPSVKADASQNFGKAVVLSLVDIFPKCLWPLCGILALCFFRGPIYNPMELFSHQLSSGASVEIGAVKVALQKKSIPNAPGDVQKILPEMDLDLILFYGAKRWRQKYGRYLPPRTASSS